MEILRDHKKVIILLIALVIIVSLSLLLSTINESKAEETYRGVVHHKCTFSYTDQVENRVVDNCYSRIDGVLEASEGNLPISSKEGVILDHVNPSITIKELNASRVWKSKVISPSIPQERYDNVGEPSFASNGTLVFYAGNHYAAKSVAGKDWKYVDPYFDFKGVEVEESNSTDSNFSRLVTPIFKADQHVEYDPIRKMYVWIRQGEQILSGGSLSNIDRLAISRDLHRWVVYDLISIDVLSEARIIRAVFDYPDTVLTSRYLYLTTSVSDNEQSQYGLIFRISLDDLSNSLDQPVANIPDINYEVVLDRDVETVTPVDGASNPMYFGSHLPNNSSVMKLYSWFNDSPTLNSTKVTILPWNAIKNSMICNSNPEMWWCNANTSSRIRSAWVLGNSINFLWNAVTSYNRGVSWLSYIDSATFYVNESMSYERKYHIADQNTSWAFGSAFPNKQGDLGVGAFYVNARTADSLFNPYMNFAFGVFNSTMNKWEMMPILNSSARLPVINEEGNNDYNIGDFLTTRSHIGNDTYSWDVGSYIIVGSNYYNIEPYYIMIRK